MPFVRLAIGSGTGNYGPSCCCRDIPELGLPPSNSINPYVLRMPECQTDGPTGHVAPITVHVVPLLPIAKEECFTVTLQSEVLTAQTECCTSLGICHTNAVADPVLDIVAPSQFAANGDVTVVEVQDVHDFGDGIITFHDLNLTVLATLLEGVHDERAVILGAGRSDGAEGASLGHTSKRWYKEKPEMK